jgi:CHAT domain-containing protein
MAAGAAAPGRGREAPALAAYQRAVSHLESVRQDIPIEYEDGRSSFQATLEPIYLGYTDLLLRQLDKQPAEVQAAQLPKVLNALEWIRQAELQDFLGDRCAVEAVQGSDSARVPPGTAVLYPVILPDRIELLLQTSSGIQRRTTAIAGATLRATAQTLADALRNGLEDYLGTGTATERLAPQALCRRLRGPTHRLAGARPGGGIASGADGRAA